MLEIEYTLDVLTFQRSLKLSLVIILRKCYLCVLCFTLSAQRQEHPWLM